VPDPIPGHEDFKHLSEIYFESESHYTGRFTVPVLYDKKQNVIVSNESSEIIRMLGTEVLFFCFSFLSSMSCSPVLLIPWKI
jgi:putative glutathione S-transferase